MQNPCLTSTGGIFWKDLGDVFEHRRMETCQHCMVQQRGVVGATVDVRQTNACETHEMGNAGMDLVVHVRAAGEARYSQHGDSRNGTRTLKRPEEKASPLLGKGKWLEEKTEQDRRDEQQLLELYR